MKKMFKLLSRFSTFRDYVVDYVLSQSQGFLVKLRYEIAKKITSPEFIAELRRLVLLYADRDMPGKQKKAQVMRSLKRSKAGFSEIVENTASHVINGVLEDVVAYVKQQQ